MGALSGVELAWQNRLYRVIVQSGLTCARQYTVAQWHEMMCYELETPEKSAEKYAYGALYPDKSGPVVTRTSTA